MEGFQLILILYGFVIWFKYGKDRYGSFGLQETESRAFDLERKYIPLCSFASLHAITFKTPLQIFLDFVQ